jgi:hypothetical protein
MIKPGIHIGLGMEEYHAWNLDKDNLQAGPISCSMLKQFAKNPFAWLRAEPFKPTAAMQTGSLLDAALTEPETLDARCVVSPYENYRKKEAQEWKANALDQGRLIVTEESLENAKACAEAVRSHDVAGAMLDGADFQVGVVGSIGKIPAKCLIDIVPGRGEYEETLVDFKTTSGGLDDEAIRKTMGQYQYHHQAAFYRTLYNQVSEDRLCEQFAFIFQDPMTREVRVVTLADDALALGTRGVGAAVKEFAQCAYKGIRSRYEKTNSTLDLMPYHAMAEDETLTLNQDN